jgi:hypothetical protein
MASIMTSGTAAMWDHARSTEREPTTRQAQKPDAEESGKGPERGTAVVGLTKQDKGDPDLKDESSVEDLRRARLAFSAEAAEARRKVAEALVPLADRAKRAHGSIRLNTELQLLRRELSRAHDVLQTRPSETDYLSIVVLVEEALVGKKAREVTQDTLRVAAEILNYGLVKQSVSYDDFNIAFRKMNAPGHLIGPEVNLDGTEEKETDERDDAVLR